MQEISVNGSDGGILQLRPTEIKGVESTLLEGEGDQNSIGRPTSAI
jgi:hypothetical protein